MSSQFIGVFSIGTTLDRGIRLYKLVLKRVFPVLLLPMLIGMLPYTQLNTSGATLGIQGTSLLFLLNFAVGIWVWIVIFRYMQKVALGEQLSVSEMLKLPKPVDQLLVLTYILWFIAFFAGSLALLIPGIYIMNLLFMGIIVATIEKQYLVNGIFRTFSLTWKRWWKTFAINIIAFSIIFVPIMAAMLVLGTTTVFNSMANQYGAQSSLGVAQIVSFLVYYAIIALVAPIFSSIMLVHYYSLRSEKEHLDIETAINEIG